MKIKVTSQHIKKGRRGSCDRCPVALAMKEALDRKFEVLDDTACDLSTYIDYKLPMKAQRFIGDFDKKKPVKPFEFTIRGLE